jgi:hypothetical protein
MKVTIKFYFILLQLVNICSIDGQRIYNAFAIGPMVIGGPLISVVGCSYVIYLVGPWALVGATIFLLYYPYQVFYSHKKILCITRTFSQKYCIKCGGVYYNYARYTNSTCFPMLSESRISLKGGHHFICC